MHRPIVIVCFFSQIYFFARCFASSFFFRKLIVFAYLNETKTFFLKFYILFTFYFQSWLHFFQFIDQLHLCKHFEQYPSVLNCEVQHLAFGLQVVILGCMLLQIWLTVETISVSNLCLYELDQNIHQNVDFDLLMCWFEKQVKLIEIFIQTITTSTVVKL